MPSGNVHNRATVLTSVSCLGVGLAVGALYPQTGGPLVAGLGYAGGCLLGVLLTPDLDQEGINHGEWWLVQKTLGLGFLWLMLWYPYARLMKHRSFWSHCPVVGTVGRLAYLGIFVAALYFAGFKLPTVPVEWLAWGLGGLAVSDTLHWAMDAIFRPSSRNGTSRSPVASD